MAASTLAETINLLDFHMPAGFPSPAEGFFDGLLWREPLTRQVFALRAHAQLHAVSLHTVQCVCHHSVTFKTHNPRSGKCAFAMGAARTHIFHSA